MICVNCGSTLPEGTKVCDVCGAKQPAANAASSSLGHRLKGIGIGVGIGVAVVLAFAIPSIALSPNGSSSSGSQSASTVITQNELVVPVQATGLDAGGSRIAVRISGLTASGVQFDQEGFVNHEGKGLTLEKGMYEITAIGSPITSAGAIYTLPSDSVSIEVNDNGGSSYNSSSVLVLTPADAASVTDEQIEAARAYILKDPERSANADQLASLARQYRDAAVAAKEAKGKEDKKTEDDGSLSNDANDSSSHSDSSNDSSNSSNNRYSDSDSDSNYNYNNNYSNNYSYSNNNNNSDNSGSTYQPPAEPTPAPEQSAQPAPSETSNDGGQDYGGGSNDSASQVDPAPADSGSSSSSYSPESNSSPSDSGSSGVTGADSGSAGSGEASSGASAGGADSGSATATTTTSTTTSGTA